MGESDATEVDDNRGAEAPIELSSGKAGFWLFVWSAVVLAGAVFGLLIGLAAISEGIGPALGFSALGFVIGLLYAGIVAGPVVLVAATLSWAVGTKRLRALWAVIAGGATGIFCTLPAVAASDGHELAGLAVATLAGLLGALGGWIGTLLWAKSRGPTAEGLDDGLRDAGLPVASRLFRIGVLVVVVAVFVAACLSVCVAVRQSREAARRATCVNHLRQIALCLQHYEMTHGRLPLAFFTDKAGKPMLSWRVAAAQSSFYNVDFSAVMQQPWNSPKNKELLDGMAYFVHCPSSETKSGSPRTDYVAVVGPDTLWPGTTPGDRKQHPQGILVVEWPKSDIHWAEPRDITVEEFLDWFRAKRPHRGFWDWFRTGSAEQDGFHPGCLLYVDATGKVGELPNDTDPETVRKLLAGRSTAAAASPAPSGR